MLSQFLIRWQNPPADMIIFGAGGAGHFIKMIHNGIEYGIMQSLAEGFEILEKAPYRLDLLKVAKLWQKGTLVSGFMLDRAADVLAKDPSLSKSSGCNQGWHREKASGRLSRQKRKTSLLRLLKDRLTLEKDHKLIRKFKNPLLQR